MEPSFIIRAHARRLGVICLALVVGCAVRSEAPTATVQEKDEAKVGGTGTKHKGAEGMMGDPSKTMPAATAMASNAPTPKPMQDAKGPGYGGGGYGAIGSLSSPPGIPLATATPKVTAEPIPMLDPNARYATTYRPGGAALSSFDAAIARGALPSTTKDLVGEFGARYAPPIDPPKTGAMAFSVDLERAAVGPNGGPVHLRIAMKGSDVAPLRAPLSVHVVLDVSGSMAGASIDHARKAAEALVEKLEPGDHFSLVTFSNDARVLIPAGAIGPRKAKVIESIRAIATEGGTNISAGLDLGYLQAQANGAPEGAVKIVMLLSDGHANGGDTNPKSLAMRSAKAFQESVQTSTFGIGTDFDGALLSSIADQGAGAYYYVAEPAQIAPALTKELDARLVPVAQAVEVRVRLRPGIGATKVYGSHALDGDAAALIRAQEIAVDNQVQKKDKIAADRKDDATGGMRFFIPAFARGDRHAMLLTLQLPSGVGEKSIASVEIKFKDRLLKKNVTQEIPLKATWSLSDADSAKTINPSVQATVQAFAAGDTIWRAAEMIDHGDRTGARALLVERATLLRKAKDTFNDPKLGEDATRIDKLADAVLGPSQVNDPLVLAVLLRGSGNGYLR
jgi:Ca-activated chloride channel homolog